MIKKISILGSTGSIGTQALEVIDHHPGKFELISLTAGNNVELLALQALKYKPKNVCIANENKLEALKSALRGKGINIFAGEEALRDLAADDASEMVLTALVGYAGLIPTMLAIKNGKDIALANKETLVVAGALVMKAVRDHKVQMLPVDSEHSALFQCLNGEAPSSVEKLILTASGGPFRGKDRTFLSGVGPGDALKHPNWEMGAKITIDSASLMNKGLEVIEARWLFDIEAADIDVVVHPQSIIHSMVQFKDGSIIAQMGLPDMKLPIQYAMHYPDRLPNQFKRFSFTDYPNLTFEQPDKETFRCLALAFEALERGGNACCIVNAANEIAVDAFLKEKISFLQIPEMIESALEGCYFSTSPSLEDLIASNAEVRAFCEERV